MLRIDNLKVALDSESGIVRAIDGLDLAIRRGETFALVGESGCGKSMTALALLRLLPENGVVTDGRVLIDAPAGSAEGSTELMSLPEAVMRTIRGRRIGMIFQEPSTSLNPVMKVGDQIVEAIETHTALRGAAARERAIHWLQRVGIPEPERRIDEYPFRMSGGQKQRVMIAMTLASEPDFIVADEPTTALDVTIQKQILDLLRELQREQGLGLLLITHDLAVVSGMAHRVALMYAGQIIEVAEASTFFAAPRHPYAQALLRALPDAARRGEPLAAIAGTVPALTQSFAGCRFAPRCDRALAQCATQLPPVVGEGDALVRCWLHAPGVAAPAAPAAPVAAAATPAATPGDQVLLQVKHLHVKFPIRRGALQRVAGHFNAVNDVSFDVRAGQTLALVGESGCGKTTTGKAIVQLLRRQATIEGEALLDTGSGARNLFALDGEPLRDARREVQIVFQDPFASLNPRMRVFDILDEGLAALQTTLGADERRARIERLTQQVGLRPDALERYPHEFSGGQRQRIAIARALVTRPKLIVADEPVSALDVSVQAQVLNLMQDLQERFGLAYLFISHDLAVVDLVCDDVIVLHHGLVVEAGPAAQVLRAPQHDYTRRLLAAVPGQAAMWQHPA